MTTNEPWSIQLQEFAQKERASKGIWEGLFTKGWRGPTKGGKLCFETSCKSQHLLSTLECKYMYLFWGPQRSGGRDWNKPPETYLSLSSCCEWQIGVKTPYLNVLSANEQKHMDYISFQLHMSLTIKHKRVLGAKGLLRLYKIQTVRSAVRESAREANSAGCREKLNLDCILHSHPHPTLLGLSLSLSLSVLFLSVSPGLPPPPVSGSPLPSGCSRTSWKHISQLPWSNSQSSLRL